MEVNYLISTNGNDIQDEIFFRSGEKEYILKTSGEKTEATFSDVDEETEDLIKIWMSTKNENKLVTLPKSFLNIINVGPCEAVYFECKSNNFMDRNSIDTLFAGICGRKTTTRLASSKYKPYHYLCRCHSQHIISFDKIY